MNAILVKDGSYEDVQIIWESADIIRMLVETTGIPAMYLTDEDGQYRAQPPID